VKKLNESQLQMEIIDNGIGRKKSAEIKQQKLLKRKSVGIKLSKERLKHFGENYNNTSDLNITDLYDNDEPIGTKVCIIIPLI
jgi:sensor histidine kinase YesM